MGTRRQSTRWGRLTRPKYCTVTKYTQNLDEEWGHGFGTRAILFQHWLKSYGTFKSNQETAPHLANRTATVRGGSHRHAALSLEQQHPKGELVDKWPPKMQRKVRHIRSGITSPENVCPLSRPRGESREKKSVTDETR